VIANSFSASPNKTSPIQTKRVTKKILNVDKVSEFDEKLKINNMNFRMY